MSSNTRNNWVHDTPRPRPTIHAPSELGATADHLVHRAAEILAPPPITPAHRSFFAVSALLATAHGYNAEGRVTPGEIEWAMTYGGALHIIEHADGAVTFTKEHRNDCPFITSAGAQECDDGCYFDHPAELQRRSQP